MGLFWTATDDGTVGTIALVILVPRPGKVFWKLDNEGYLVRKEGLENLELQNQESDDTQHPDDSDVKDDTADDPEGYYYASAEPFSRFDGLRGIDSLGRPITDRTVRGHELSTGQLQQPHHPWSLQDVDEEALEKERLERIKKAEVLVKSRDLLRRLFDGDDDDSII